MKANCSILELVYTVCGNKAVVHCYKLINIAEKINLSILMTYFLHPNCYVNAISIIKDTNHSIVLEDLLLKLIMQYMCRYKKKLK